MKKQTIEIAEDMSRVSPDSISKKKKKQYSFVNKRRFPPFRFSGVKENHYVFNLFLTYGFKSNVPHRPMFFH